MIASDWMEQPAPLEQIPGTSIWGGDFPAPALPRTVCTMVVVGRPGSALPSSRHNEYMHGSDLPPLPTAEGEPSTLADGVAFFSRSTSGLPAFKSRQVSTNS